MELKDFWNHRFENHGHTGWSNQTLYEYDQKNRLAAFSRLINLDSCSEILDLGCGTGDFIELLKQLIPSSKVYGVDISDETIGFAKQRLVGLEDVDLNCSDITTVEFDKGRFDLVYSITVLQHISSKEDLLDLLMKLHSSLTDNGKFLFLENVYCSGDSKGEYINTGFSTEDWTSVVKEAGFNVEKVMPYPQWGVLLVETCIELLSKLRSLAGNANRNQAQSTVVANSGMSGRKESIIKSVLFLASILDRKLRIPIPQKIARYEIFLCSK